MKQKTAMIFSVQKAIGVVQNIECSSASSVHAFSKIQLLNASY